MVGILDAALDARYFSMHRTSVVKFFMLSNLTSYFPTTVEKRLSFFQKNKNQIKCEYRKNNVNGKVTSIFYMSSNLK